MNDDEYYPLTKWDTTKNTNSKPAVYIMQNDVMITISENDSISYGVEDLSNNWNCLIPFKCLTCNGIGILKTIIECTEVVNRNQGIERYYTATEIIYCRQCEQEISMDILITHYVSNWFCEIDCSDAILVWIDGFYWICKQLTQLKLEISNFEHRKITHLHHIKKLVEENHSSLILLVEGRDDVAIWKQLLIKEDVNLTKISIEKYGHGGIEEAIKAAKFFRTPGLKSIPHKLILDSDGNPSELTTRLTRKEKLDRKSFHILEQKEIESYLIEPRVIAKILNKEINEVEACIAELKGSNGKEKLEKIFKIFHGPKVTREIKEMIVIHLLDTPLEIRKILHEIDDKIRNIPTIDDLDDALYEE